MDDNGSDYNDRDMYNTYGNKVKDEIKKSHMTDNATLQRHKKLQ